MDSLLAVCFQVFARSTSVIVAVINMIICLRKVLRNLTARFVQNLLKKIKSVHIGGLLFFFIFDRRINIFIKYGTIKTALKNLFFSGVIDMNFLRAVTL